MQTPTGKIPTLDGWRGIAILLVLLAHTLGVRTGQHGVTIFFVLSGFLITAKLLESPIDLKKFYIRRFFRLMPAAWTYLAFVVICDAVLHEHRASLGHLASCVFFYRNYSSFYPGEATAHFWSLSMEEQFYLVWPVLLLLLGVRRCRWLAVAAVAACASWRHRHWAFYSRLGFNYRTEARADALLVGCLLAILMSSEAGAAFVSRWSKWWALPALCGLGFYVLRYRLLPPLGENVCIAALIAASVHYASEPLAKWLDARPLAFVGVISYSIYVWQQYFLQIRRGPVLTALMMVALPVVAVWSYRVVETPCRNFGHWITRKRQRPETQQVPLGAPQVGTSRAD